MRRIPALAIVLAIALLSALPAARTSAASCVFATSGKTMTLAADCATTTSIVVPNGFTLDGAGHTITAVDPTGDHFKGGVIRNGGTSANVRNVTITAAGLADVCDGGADRLRGVLFDGAGGSITRVTVKDLNQGASGCQEGNAIEVRNFDAPGTFSVTISDNSVLRYQKNGITTNGRVRAKITNNVVDGGGPVSYIARNGIQVGYGADAEVKFNTVSGNSYTGPGYVSGGILVVGGPGYGGDYTTGTDIVQNTVTNNDVGVFLSNVAADGGAPATATNVKVVNNTISNTAVTSGYIYQAGVADTGNNDKIINNTISGAGYTCATFCYTVDADPSFTNRAKVHANK